MGEVYAAEDTRLGREVALKVLLGEVPSDRVRLERFEREARAVAALNHPAIVTIYSVEEDGGVPFLTMELVKGAPLGKLIPPRGMPIEKIFPIAVPLADALSAAHAAGIVHRDLKPGNIMVTDDGRVKILDFGLAKLLARPLAAGDPEDLTEPLTQAGQVVGTVPYMSPEQVRGEPADERSDIFSLGIILHEVAVGRRAFAARTSADVISSILRDEPESVASIRPELPHHLGRIVGLCLAKAPERRYQSALDLRNELAVLEKEVARGEVRPTTLSGEQPAPAPRRPRGRRFVQGVAALLAVALLVILASVLNRGPTADRELSSVAVLPLANLTGDPDQSYLGEGISAGLVTQLGEIAALRVVGRSEAWRLSDQELSASEIGRRLGVDVIVEGSLQRDGGGLQVGLDLTDVSTGEVVWSTTGRGERERLFELQRGVAEQLARYLSIPVSRAERRRLTKNPTGSRRAYEHYLHGQQYLEAVDNPRSAHFAAEVFRQAIKLDSEFALAHVGLSEALWKSYQSEKRPDLLSGAESAAERALELDPGLPPAQVALARVHRASGRYAASLAELRPILERHPRPDEAYRELALGYEEAGEVEAAERSLEAAVALRNDHWHHWNSLGAFLLRQGRPDEARGAFETAAGLAPETIALPWRNLVALQMRQGDFAGAVEAYERFGTEVSNARLASNIGTAYFYTGKLEKAEEFYRRAVRLTPDDYGQHGNLGDVLVRRGRREEAKAVYSTAYELARGALESFPDDHQLRLSSALYAAKGDACVEAVEIAARLEKELAQTAQNLHFLAWVYSLCDQRAEALVAVRRAIGLGVSPDLIRQEDEFRRLREDVEFQRLVGTAQ